MSRIKTKTVRSTLNSAEVQELFGRALGTEGSTHDYTIIWVKFKKLRKALYDFIKLVAFLAEWMDSYDELVVQRENVKQYLLTLHSEYKTTFDKVTNLDEHCTAVEVAAASEIDRMPIFENIPKETLDKFSEEYDKATDCDLVRTAIVTCDNLTPYKGYIGNKEQIKDGFLRGAGECSPFPDLPSADFKAMYTFELNEESRSVKKKVQIPVYLNRLYRASLEVYDVYNTPEINVEEFIEVVRGSIDQLATRLPRCKRALKKIMESMELLRTNFGGYYKDMKISSNPMNLMESFVIDIADSSKEDGASVTLMAEFRQIINYYRDLASKQPKDSKVKALFEHANANFRELEKNASAQRPAETPAEPVAPPDELVPNDPPGGATYGKKRSQIRNKMHKQIDRHLEKPLAVPEKEDQ